MKRILPIIVFCLTFVLLISSAYARPWQLIRDVDVELRYTAGYDNNILELSDEDLDRFDTGTLPAHDDLETYDDFVQTFGFRVRVTSPPIIGFRKARLYYTLGYHSYLKNPQTDRMTHSLFITQDVTRKVDLLGSYFFMPSKYLRDYYDRDWERFYPTEFDYHEYSLGVRADLTDWLRVDVRYEGYQVYYNKWFTEYDTESDGLRASAQIEVSDPVTVNLQFRKRWADNTGFDEATLGNAGGTDDDAEFGDGGYGEEYFEYGITWQSPEFLAREWTIELAYRIRHRYYTSDMDWDRDPFHSGREHIQQRLFLDVDTDINDRIGVGISFEYEWRETDSPVDVVPLRKDFDAFRSTLRLSYEIW